MKGEEEYDIQQRLAIGIEPSDGVVTWCALFHSRYQCTPEIVVWQRAIHWLCFFIPHTPFFFFLHYPQCNSGSFMLEGVSNLFIFRSSQHLKNKKNSPLNQGAFKHISPSSSTHKKIHMVDEDSRNDVESSEKARKWTLI